MFKWLRRFFYSDDEIVKLADGLSDFDSAQFEETLRSAGIAAMRKDLTALAAYRSTWAAGPPNAYALFVKQSDVKIALEILRPMLERGQLAEAALKATGHGRSRGH